MRQEPKSLPRSQTSISTLSDWMSWAPFKSREPMTLSEGTCRAFVYAFFTPVLNRLIKSNSKNVFERESVDLLLGFACVCLRTVTFGCSLMMAIGLEFLRTLHEIMTKKNMSPKTRDLLKATHFLTLVPAIMLLITAESIPALFSSLLYMAVQMPGAVVGDYMGQHFSDRLFCGTKEHKKIPPACPESRPPFQRG